ncbi:acidic leucine-rich nuclear phosphoprotein 32 family member E-like [Cervus canadensis]|uniref:acidic leucine-rich nuclear phosphoprotein 32 family member E-like n=1 Tax=Cervus canadensis TaxID=1574408 RepID=UPI001CA34E37|nr:acidic leucine-rich nuclear phosphoprotein 32 family member E-like [Cervus canadensis]
MAVARAVLEEGARQQATQPTIQENRHIPSAEQEEDLEEGEEEEEEEELDYDGMEKDEYEEKDHDDEFEGIERLG